MTMLVRDVMTRDPLTVRPETPVDTIVALLEARGFRHLPVVDATGRLVGVVTDRDVVGRATASASWLVDAEQKEMLHAMRAGEIATEDPTWVAADATVQEAATLLLREHVSCLPVLDGGALVGILTSSDLVRMVAKG